MPLSLPRASASLASWGAPLPRLPCCAFGLMSASWMSAASTLSDRRGLWAFILGVILVTGGVLLHAPMFLMGRNNHFVLAGMTIGWDMVAGMAAIVCGCGVAAYGLPPRGTARPARGRHDHPVVPAHGH